MVGKILFLQRPHVMGNETEAVRKEKGITKEDLEHAKQYPYQYAHIFPNDGPFTYKSTKENPNVEPMRTMEMQWQFKLKPRFFGLE